MYTEPEHPFYYDYFLSLRDLGEDVSNIICASTLGHLSCFWRSYY